MAEVARGPVAVAPGTPRQPGRRVQQPLPPPSPAPPKPKKHPPDSNRRRELSRVHRAPQPSS